MPSKWYWTHGGRQRWFCCLCGRMLAEPELDTLGYAYCPAHADLSRVDLIPPDPLTTIPPMHTVLDTGHGTTIEMWPVPEREDMLPAEGTEA